MTRLREKRACPSPNTSGCSAQTRPGGLTPLALALAALLAALACADAAFARRPSRRNNAAAAAAAKKKAVASIRAQIAAAQQVLASAEAAGYASQGQLEPLGICNSGGSGMVGMKSTLIFRPNLSP